MVLYWNELSERRVDEYRLGLMHDSDAEDGTHRPYTGEPEDMEDGGNGNGNGN